MSVQFSSVQSLSRVQLFSIPWFAAHQASHTHVHRVSDAIQRSHPLSSPSPPAPNPSQHQSLPMSQLFAWGGQSTGVSALASFLPKKSQGWSPSEQSSKYQIASRLLLGKAHELRGTPLSGKRTESLTAESRTVTLREKKKKKRNPLEKQSQL